MRYLLTPIGSAGDVHPFVGIGRRLQARGHDVTILTAAPFDALVREAGLAATCTASLEEYQSVIDNPDLWHPRRGPKLVFGMVTRLMRRSYDTLSSLYEPGRTVLVGHTLSFATRVFEEVHGAPAATLDLAPSVLRSDFQQPILEPGRDLTRFPRAGRSAPSGGSSTAPPSIRWWRRR